MQNEMLEEFYNAEQMAKKFSELPEITMAEEKPKQEKKYTLTIDVIQSIMESTKKNDLLNWFRLSTDAERTEVFKKQNSLFTLNKKKVESLPFDDYTLEELYKYKDSNLAGYAYLLFVISCYLIKERPQRKGRTNELQDKIKEEKERRRIQKLKGLKFADKLKKHYDKITDLRNQGMSWRLLAQYLKKHYAKYYQDYELNYSYLRREYNKLHEKKTLNK